MIVDNKIFKRIQILKEESTGYKYILLAFFKNKVELFFSAQDFKIIKHFSNIVPLLLIYDKDREQKNKSNKIDSIIFKVLKKRIDDVTTYLLQEYLKNISYTDFISNEEKYTKIIDSAIKTINLISKFEKLNKDYLSVSNRRELKKLEKKAKKEKDDDKSSMIEEKESSRSLLLQTFNINKILRSSKSIFLNNFFFDKDGVIKESIFKIENSFSKSDIQSIMALFLKNEHIHISKSSRDYYNEILNEIEYCNLYDYDTYLDNDRYKELHYKLFSSMTKNRISSMKNTLLEYDMFLNMKFGLEIGFREYMYQYFYDKYNTSYQEYENEDNEDKKILELIFNNQASSQSTYELYEKRYQEYVETEMKKFSENHLDEYISNLHIGEIKHKK